MNNQMELSEAIEIPTWLECKIHEGYDPRAYYTDFEIENMLIEQGFIDCPMCLSEICDQGAL